MHTGWIPRLSERFLPRSLSAYLFALGAVALATLARVALGWLDVTLLYATYFPMVMLVALVSGPAVALFASLVSVLVVWWAFVPPFYIFNALTGPEAANAALFVASCTFMIWVAQLYRNAIARLRENDRQNRLLMRELEHRGKNTFAVVESIVRSSLEELPDRAATIVGRIRAVSSTNDVINRSPEHTSTIEDILRREFEPYGLQRLNADGDGVELEANIARGVVLVLHELVTNAVKHGALSAGRRNRVGPLAHRRPRGCARLARAGRPDRAAARALRIRQQAGHPHAESDGRRYPAGIPAGRAVLPADVLGRPALNGRDTALALSTIRRYRLPHPGAML